MSTTVFQKGLAFLRGQPFSERNVCLFRIIRFSNVRLSTQHGDICRTLRHHDLLTTFIET